MRPKVPEDLRHQVSELVMSAPYPFKYIDWVKQYGERLFASFVPDIFHFAYQNSRLSQQKNPAICGPFQR
jgi:hypothetical protein